MWSFAEFLTEHNHNTQLFHKDIGIPPSLLKPLAGVRLTYGHHAKRAADDDGIEQLPGHIPAEYTTIEVESIEGRATKWVLRFPLAHTKRDLVIVVMADGFVKTVWTNARDDKHSTLKKWLYTPPSQFRAN